MRIHALVVLLLVAGSCAAEPRDSGPEWPIACTLFPPQADAIADCARRDDDGELRLRPGVLTGEGASEGVSAVLIEGELFFALNSGRTAPALFFDNGPDYFVEGLARSMRDGKIGFVNERLDLVVPRQWDFAFPFEQGVARVCTGCAITRGDGDEHGTVDGGVWGLIDREGRVVAPAESEQKSLPPEQ